MASIARFFAEHSLLSASEGVPYISSVPSRDALTVQHHRFSRHPVFNMPVSVHSIRALPSSYTAGPSSPSSSSSVQRLSNLGHFVQKHPPGLSLSSWRANIAAHCKPADSSSKRSALPTIRLPYTARRVQPPPTPPARVTAIVYMAEEDSSSFDPLRTVIYDSHSSRSRRSSSLKHYTSDPDFPQQVAMATDKEARSKLVAGILLHRVHAVGKPIRRAPHLREGPREYIRSGLSSMITLEC